MARKGLTDMVIAEADRAMESVRPMLAITDPMTAHALSMVLDNLGRIVQMCEEWKASTPAVRSAQLPAEYENGAAVVANDEVGKPVAKIRPVRNRKPKEA